MTKPIDEMFLETCLEELRGGETVTVAGPEAVGVRAWLEEVGATEGELARLITPGVKARAKKPAKPRMSKEDRGHLEHARRTAILARLVGYNEMAKSALTLGEKVWFRFAVQAAHRELLEAGGKLEITEGETPLMHIGERPPHINLYPRDIELMRAAVKAHDATAVRQAACSHPSEIETFPARCADCGKVLP